MDDYKEETCTVCGSKMVPMMLSSFCPSCEAKNNPPASTAQVSGLSNSAPSSNCNGLLPGRGNWTREKALDICEILEPILSQTGPGWHIGLTGGALYKKGQRKDLDLIIYPHRVNHHVPVAVNDINTAIDTIAYALGLSALDAVIKSSHYRDGKVLYKVGDSIDVFVFGTK